MKSLFRLGLPISLLALVAGIVVVRTQGPLDRPTGGDGPYFIALAQAMASGDGYVFKRGPWAGHPHLSRLPVWPALLTPGAWLFPHANEFVSLRSTGILVFSVAATLLALLAYRLTADYLAAFLTGAMFALYPPGLALIDSGYSEHAFIATSALGTLLLFGSGWRQVLGAGFLGLSVLVRSNFLILPFLLAFIVILWHPSLLQYWKRMAVLTLIFLLPAALWILRNYVASGDFPLLSAMDGETLYGANNDVVAKELYAWGYWVFPDDIPGETPKLQLAKRMDEAQLNRYYRKKGIAYIRNNWFSYPRLIVGKLIRGFVPVPWVPLRASYLASLCRLMLYGAFFWSFRAGFLQDRMFGLMLAAVLLVTLTTTVTFYGTFRFTFCLEPFLMPFVGVWLARQWQRRTIVDAAKA